MLRQGSLSKPIVKTLRLTLHTIRHSGAFPLTLTVQNFPETMTHKIPELRTVFISGDIATVKAGTNAVSYREKSSASVWNASSVTKKRFLAITLTDSGDVPAAIKTIAEVFHEAEKPSEKTAEKPAE